MRKIFVCAFGAFLMVASAAGFTGCKKTSFTRPHYTIEGEFFPETQKLVAQMTVDVPNVTDSALESLSFELWANAYREGAAYQPVSKLYSPAAYYAGTSYGGIDIASVEGAVKYEIGGEDKNILSVTLQEPLFPDETVSVSVGFEVTLANVNHRLGVGEHNVILSGFYPVLCARGDSGFLEYVYSSNGDPFVSDCADYDVTLTFPEEYEIAYSGTGEVTQSNGKKQLVARAEGARDVAYILGTELKSIKETVGGTQVEYFYLSDASPEQTLTVAKESLAYYSETFGEYEYPKYTLVQTDFPYGGMEYSGLAVIAADLQAGDIPAVVAHETAHQWWYSMVGSNQFETPWLDEGLAEYSAALFLGEHPQYGTTYQQFVSQCVSGYRSYFSVKTQLSGETDTTMNRPLTAYSGEYEYRNIAYDKGVILLDKVRSVAGDRSFFASMKKYFAQNTGRIASPEDFISCFKGSVEELFRSFTDGKCVI